MRKICHRSRKVVLTHHEKQKSDLPVSIINLGSGSSGNSTLLCHGNKILMIDCGFSRKQAAIRMTAMDLNPQDVCGILLTHEHGDHIKGARLCSQTWDAPIMATAGTLAGSGLSHLDCHTLKYEEVITHHGFEITTLKISHDTNEPCAFLVDAGGVRSLFITDIGTLDDFDISPLTNIDYLFIEANHDEVMLRTGSYPAFLKNRITGAGGHLNNQECGLLIRSLASQSPDLQAVMLAHLSHENNTPEYALGTAREYAGSLSGVRWIVAHQIEPKQLK